MVKQQERIQMVEMEEDTSIGRMRETLDKIQRIYRKTDIIKTQWERKQTFLQDMSKIEATVCKYYNRPIQIQILNRPIFFELLCTRPNLKRFFFTYFYSFMPLALN